MDILLSKLRPAPTTARKTGGRAELYYIRIRAGRTYWKIGYTASGVEQRVKQLGAGLELDIEVVDRLEFGREQQAYRAEQTLHLFFRTYYGRHRYKFKELGRLLTSGDSEVYTSNVMDMPELLRKAELYNRNYWQMLRRIEAKKLRYRRANYRREY